MRACAATRELQQHLMACVSAVRALVSQLEAAAEGSHELGRALSHLARYEEALAQRHEGLYSPAGQAAAARGADLQVAGYGLLRQHAVEKQVRRPRVPWCYARTGMRFGRQARVSVPASVAVPS